MGSSTCSIKLPVSGFKHCDTPLSDECKPWLWDKPFHYWQQLMHIWRPMMPAMFISLWQQCQAMKNNITISMWKKVSTRHQGIKQGPSALYILWAILQAVTHLVVVVVIGLSDWQGSTCRSHNVNPHPYLQKTLTRQLRVRVLTHGR